MPFRLDDFLLPGTSMEGLHSQSPSEPLPETPEKNFLPEIGVGYSTGGSAGVPPLNTPAQQQQQTGGSLQDQVLGILNRVSPQSSPQALGQAESELGKLGVTLQKMSDGTIRGRLFHGGYAYDVVPPNQWGAPWTWINRGAFDASAAQGGGGGQFGTGVGGFGTEFMDPWGSSLEAAVQARLAALGQSPHQPALDDFISRLLEADKAKQAQVQELAASIKNRAAELRQPAYTEQDEAVIRAKAFDQLERRRQETLRNRREDIYARGFAPTSGLVVGAEDAVHDRFEGARTGIESDLTHSAIAETQRRKDKALSLDQLVEQALSGGDLTSLQFLSQIADIEDSRFRTSEDRMREAIATHLVPLDLMNNRFQMGLQAAGMGGNPQSVVNSILGLLQAGQQGRGLNLQSNMNQMAGIGQLLSMLNFGSQQ